MPIPSHPIPLPTIHTRLLLGQGDPQIKSNKYNNNNMTQGRLVFFLFKLVGAQLTPYLSLIRPPRRRRPPPAPATARQPSRAEKKEPKQQQHHHHHLPLFSASLPAYPATRASKDAGPRRCLPGQDGMLSPAPPSSPPGPCSAPCTGPPPPLDPAPAPRPSVSRSRLVPAQLLRWLVLRLQQRG